MISRLVVGLRATGWPARLAVASAAVQAEQDQLWEQLKSDADSTFSDASALITRSADAQHAAASFQEKINHAKAYVAPQNRFKTL
ncbi:hypothetical protein ABBQ38_014181 [Trebouxia sp. C0009 RCD-2024]